MRTAVYVGLHITCDIWGEKGKGGNIVKGGSKGRANGRDQGEGPRGQGKWRGQGEGPRGGAGAGVHLLGHG